MRFFPLDIRELWVAKKLIFQIRQLFFVCFVITLITTFLFAQSVTSALRGVVTDAQNAVVPNATVILEEPSTNQKKTATTDANGNYEFGELRPGTYKVTITKDGFASYVAENILVENLQTRRIDAQMQVAGTGVSTVTVDAGAAVITTEGGTITSSITKDRVADSPTVDTYPNPYELFKTLPGVQGDGWDIKVVGQNSAQQTIGLDGVINDRFGEQNNNINFYEEANLTTVNATADNSRVVNYNLVSKRGQNKFHAMAYYKRFDDAFNARDTFTTRRYSQLQHEVQVEGSGPIWKNKTFFYASWFYHRVPATGEGLASVPSDAWRAGDFTNLLGLGNPIYLKNPFAPTGATCAPPADISGCLRDPSRATSSNPNGLNIIPLNLINPISLKFQNYIPKANDINVNSPIRTGTDLTRTRPRPAHRWIHPFPGDYFRASFPFIRIDHQITDKNSIYGKWTQRKTPYVLIGNMPGFEWTRLRDHSQISFTDTHIFTSNIINNFTFGLSRDFIEDGLETSGYNMFDGNQIIADTGIQGMNPGELKGAGFPQINFNSNLATLATPTSGGIKNNDKTYSFENNLTWATGKHSLKFGGNYVRFKTFSGEVPNYGTVSFTGIWSAVNTAEIGPEHAYADFLLGAVRRSSRGTPRINRVRNINELGLYAMDSYKISQNLTLDLGLRWEFYGLPIFKDGLMYNFDPATGNVIIPSGTRGEVDPRYPVVSASNPNGINLIEGEVVPKAYLKNFRPRIGVAYRFSENLVLRGGYGSFTERFSRFYTDFALGGGPFNKSGENFEATSGTTLSINNPFLTGNAGLSPLGAQSVSGFPLQQKEGTIHQYNVSIEKELFGLGFRSSYIGSRGVNLRAFVNLNAQPLSASGETSARPYPKFVRNGISYLRNDFGSRYDSIQFEVMKRRGDLTFDAHYTYAVSKNNINLSPNPFTPNAQWANDARLRRNLFVASTTWRLPVGRGRQLLSDSNWFVDAVLGGWKLSTISKFGSGFYTTPSIPVPGSAIIADNMYGGTVVRANQNGDPSLSDSDRSLLSWFNPNVYSAPAPGTFGNALANSIEGPGLNVHHASLAKTFTFNEIFKLTFTAAFSNIFNHPNYCIPNGNVTNRTITCTTGSGAGSDDNAGFRTGYLKLRFEF